MDIRCQTRGITVALLYCVVDRNLIICITTPFIRFLISVAF
jgi:hypothetical protein